MANAAAPFMLGWEEWVALPELGLPAIKAKVDTGARTSALHAFRIEPFGPPEAEMVRFGIHPVPGRTDLAVFCSAPVAGRREVTSSNGEREMRFLIRTPVRIGDRQWPIDVTLANRGTMAYRMLLGRQAIRPDIRVDPAASFLQPRLSYRLYRHLPRHDLVHRPLRVALVTRKAGSPSSRRLRAAAAARGHVLEMLDFAAISLLLGGLEPGLAHAGAALAHYDAVIARTGPEDGAFGAAVVRQLELMGSYAVNPGDSLDVLLNPLALRQVLAGRGIRSLPWTLGGAEHQHSPPRRSTGPHVRMLVIGGAVAAVVERRHGKDIDAGGRRLEEERALAERCAAALRLGLAGIDIGEAEAGAAVLAVSATPSLSAFESTTGVRAAEQVIAHIENHVRSWVRRAEAAVP